jgi:hypothetical protein
MLEVVCGRALAAPASRRSAAASTADGSEARKPAASRGPGACTVLYRYRRISGYPTIRDIRRLFHGIWIYLDHPHQLSVSTRWQNGHYPVNPDCAGANRIHALPPAPRVERARPFSDEFWRVGPDKGTSIVFGQATRAAGAAAARVVASGRFCGARHTPRPPFLTHARALATLSGVASIAAQRRQTGGGSSR